MEDYIMWRTLLFKMKIIGLHSPTILKKFVLKTQFCYFEEELFPLVQLF